MKIYRFQKRTLFGRIAGLFLLGVLFSFVLTVQSAIASISSTSIRVSVSDTPLPSLQTTPANPPEATATSAPIEVYQAIAQEAILASSYALEQMKWIIFTIFGSLIGIASGLVIYYYSQQKEALEKANQLRYEMGISNQRLEDSLKKTAELATAYIQIQQELLVDTTRYLPPEVAYEALDIGKIDKEKLRETFVWLAWTNWLMLEKEEAYSQLLEFKNSREGLPSSIRRLVVFEIEQRARRIKTRGGLLYEGEKAVIKKLLFLMDLCPVNEEEFFQQLAFSGSNES